MSAELKDAIRIGAGMGLSVAIIFALFTFIYYFSTIVHYFFF